MWSFSGYFIKRAGIWSKACFDSLKKLEINDSSVLRHLLVTFK
jgi:hypothetical protein